MEDYNMKPEEGEIDLFDSHANMNLNSQFTYYNHVES